MRVCARWPPNWAWPDPRPARWAPVHALRARWARTRRARWIPALASAPTSSRCMSAGGALAMRSVAAQISKSRIVSPSHICHLPRGRTARPPGQDAARARWGRRTRPFLEISVGARLHAPDAKVAHEFGDRRQRHVDRADQHGTAQRQGQPADARFLLVGSVVSWPALLLRCRAPWLPAGVARSFAPCEAPARSRPRPERSTRWTRPGPPARSRRSAPWARRRPSRSPARTRRAGSCRADRLPGRSRFAAGIIGLDHVQGARRLAARRPRRPR